MLIMPSDYPVGLAKGFPIESVILATSVFVLFACAIQPWTRCDFGLQVVCDQGTCFRALANNAVYCNRGHGMALRMAYLTNIADLMLV